jgi:general control protein GCN4
MANLLTPKADFDTHFDLGRLDAAAAFNWEDAGTNFTAINTGASSTQTVSPKDLFNDGLGSAPPSTAFTNLTSPDINDSPFLDSYDTSPMFQGNGDLTGENWFPLFSDTTPEEPAAQLMQRDLSTNTLSGQTDSSSGNSPLVLDQSNRRKSSPLGQSMQRHSSSSGVNRRRRQRPLPPIEVDPNDKVALKRARNTLAARDSRQRKLEHVTTLENKIAELEEQLKAYKDAFGPLPTQ